MLVESKLLKGDNHSKQLIDSMLGLLYLQLELFGKILINLISYSIFTILEWIRNFLLYLYIATLKIKERG